MKLAIAAAAALALAAGQAQALIIFSDDFNNATYGQNVSPAGWTTTGGTVDSLGPGYFDGLCTAAAGVDAYCVDLDGSTGNAGLSLQGFTLNGGTTYTAMFQLAGSQRGDTNTVAVNFGSINGSYTLTSPTDFTTFSLVFTPTTTGTYNLSFENNGGDNLGALLDNVSISTAAIPEPATWAMLIAGFGAAGAVLRRRRGALA